MELQNIKEIIDYKIINDNKYPLLDIIEIKYMSDNLIINGLIFTPFYILNA